MERYQSPNGIDSSNAIGISMICEMSLNSKPFENIKNGKKVIEIRLYDEKRQKIHPKDIIVFTRLPDKKEKIAVEVTGLSIFVSFRDLFLNFEKKEFGHPKEVTIDEQINWQWEHYTKEEELKYGVVGIHIKLLDKLPDEHTSK